MKTRFLAFAALVFCLFVLPVRGQGPIYGAPGDAVGQGIAWIGNKIVKGFNYLLHLGD